MRIKNTAELVRRANWHARYDHIEQGTYGDATVNGVAEFKGCAIACLSTPHTKKGLRDFLRGIFGGSGSGELNEFGWKSDDQRKALAKEFGICRTLALVLEGLFESQKTHGAAIEFIPAFAKALKEGSDIKPAELRKRFPELLEEADSYDPESYQVVGANHVEPLTEEFLAFLKDHA